MPEQGNTPPQPSKPGLGPPGHAIYEAPGFGPLYLAWVEEGLALLRLDGRRPADDLLRRWVPEAADGGLPERPLPPSVAERLDAYFAGQPVDPAELPVRIRGTKFQRKTWRALRGVTRGRVRTYAGLASDVRSPRSMRAIGMAMGKNPLPIVVPCHRVVAAGHALGGYSGGIERKIALLELEGVSVVDGQVRPGQLDLLP